MKKTATRKAGKMKTRLPLVLFTCLLALALAACLSSCGGKYSQKEKEYMEREVEALYRLLEFDLGALNPMYRMEFDSYLSENTENAPELLAELDEGLATCDEVLAYLDKKLETPEERATADDLEALREQVRQAACDMKELLELVRKDIEQGTYSLDVAYEMSNRFTNTYPYYFNQEACRLAEEYGLQIDIPIFNQ